MAGVDLALERDGLCLTALFGGSNRPKGHPSWGQVLAIRCMWSPGCRRGPSEAGRAASGRISNRSLGTASVV